MLQCRSSGRRNFTMGNSPSNIMGRKCREGLVWYRISWIIYRPIDLTEKIALTHETWTDVEKTRAAFAASRHESDKYIPEWVHLLCTDNRLIENFSPDNIDGLTYANDASSDIFTRAYFFSQNGWWSWHLTFLLNKQ